MNFPDLETCRAIGAEFPESEYVWLQAIEGPKATPFTESRRQFGYRTERVFKIIDNAPTCEELGEWIAKPHELTRAMLVMCYQGLFVAPCPGRNGEWFLTSIHHRLPIFHIKAPNETQARALGVKLILENKGMKL